MRIPFYQSSVSPTNEAPGRPIQARRNMALETKTKITEGAPLAQALSEVGNFTAVRINMARENLLNEAQLGLDLEMDKAFREFKQYGTPNTKFSGLSFNKILDGESPLWGSRMDEIKAKIKKNLGKDKYMNNKFDLYFSKIEQNGRLKLRGIVDQKVRAAAAQHRSMRFQLKQDEYSDADTELPASVRLYNFNQDMAKIVTDKKKLSDFGFDKTKLSKQETSFVSNTALSLIEKISIDNPNTDAASIVLDEIRTVALPSKGENAETQYTDLDENQKFAVDLLRKLPASERAAVLSSVYKVANFAEAQTTTEAREAAIAKQKNELFKESKKQIKAEAKSNIEDVGIQIGNLSKLNKQLISDTSNLHKINTSDLDAIVAQVDRHITALGVYEPTAGEKPGQSTAYKAAITLKEQIAETKLKAQTVQQYHALPNQMQQKEFIEDLENAGTQLGVETANIIKGLHKDQENAFQNNDGLSHIVNTHNLRSGGKVGKHTFTEFNPELMGTEDDFAEWFDSREKLAALVHRNYNPEAADPEAPIQYFTSKEMGYFKDIYDRSAPQNQLRLLENMVSAMGGEALDSVLDQMSENPNLVVAARLAEFAEDNPDDGQSVVATQTALFIIQGNKMAEEGQSLAWYDKKAASQTIMDIKSAFVDTAKSIIPDWQAAAESFLLGKFGKGMVREDVDYDSDDKKSMTKNAIMFGMNKILNGSFDKDISSISNFVDGEDMPFASSGGIQEFNEYFTIFLPRGMNVNTIQRNLEITTAEHINNSAAKDADGNLIYGDAAANKFEFKEDDILYMNQNPDKFGFLANTAGHYQLVMYDENREEVRAVIDRNSNPIYVDMGIFGMEIDEPIYDPGKEVKGMFTFN